MILEELLPVIDEYNKKKNAHEKKFDKPFAKKKYLECPMLFSSMLFWAVHLKMDISIIRRIAEIKNLYIEAPMLLVHKMTVFHSCAEADHHDALDLLIEKSTEKINDRITEINTNTPTAYKKFNLLQNNVLSLKKNEAKFYKKRFIKKIESFDRWINNYKLWIHKKKKNDYFLKAQDLYGNTALHIACMNARKICVEKLILAGNLYYYI